MHLKKLKTIWFWDIFAIITLSILLGFFATSLPELGGTVGYEMNQFLADYIGSTGTMLVLVLCIVFYLIYKIRISPDAIKTFFEKRKRETLEDSASNVRAAENGAAYNLEEYAIEEPAPVAFDEEEIPEPVLKPVSKFEINKDALKPTIDHPSEIILST
ncbi:MAG: DNA translocase FtsK, partial [Chryseobacterium sp.]